MNKYLLISALFVTVFAVATATNKTTVNAQAAPKATARPASNTIRPISATIKGFVKEKGTNKGVTFVRITAYKKVGPNEFKFHGDSLTLQNGFYYIDIKEAGKYKIVTSDAYPESRVRPIDIKPKVQFVEFTKKKETVKLDFRVIL